MGGGQALVDYVRRGGLAPRNDESLQIGDDGSFTMWRSASTASVPPSPVGRFGGELARDEHARLVEAVEAAGTAGDLSITPPPGAVIETVRLPVARAVVGIHERAAGPWAELLALVRPLLGALTRFPRAGLALALGEDGRSARLVALGEDALELELRALRVEAFLWRADQLVARWSAPDPGRIGQVSTGKGWSLELGFDHGFDITSESRIGALVELEAAADAATRHLSLQV